MTKYLPVRVSTFRGDKKIPFNTFVHVAGKYILFCREGDSFEGGRLERLKAKKLRKMYVSEEHFPAYQAYMHENIEKAYDSANRQPVEIRAQIIHGALQSATEDLLDDPSSQQFYNVAVEGAKKFIKFLYSDVGTLKSLLDIKNSDFSIAHHGVSVAALALVIAEEMKLLETHAMQVVHLTVGCLIHDVENNFNNIDLSVDPRKLGKTESEIQKQHAVDGAARLKKDHFYDPVVLDIVLKHDERIDGSGPLKLKEEELNPLALAAAVANAFDRLLTYENIAPKDGLKKLLIDEMGVMSLPAMKALQAALKKRGIV